MAARAQWVSQHIIPQEHRVRSWLRKWRVSRDEQDELLQEAYYRIAVLSDVQSITRPGAYFFSVVRNIQAKKMRRQRVVEIELIAEIDAFVDDQSIEEQTAYRQAFDHLIALIDALPPRCRQIVRLRKLEDWSQRQIAEHMGISEKTVETQIRLGLRALRAAWFTEGYEVLGDAVFDRRTGCV